jgi:hypothetical protein
MAEYTKMLLSGKIIEIFEYEHDPRKKKSHKQRLYDAAYPNIRTSEPKRRNRRLHKRRIDNVRRSRKIFNRLVSSNLTGETNPLLFTVTMHEVCDLTTAYGHWRKYIQRLRRRLGDDFAYVGVPEFQKRGAVHFHALFFGLDDDLGDILDRENPYYVNKKKKYKVLRYGTERNHRFFQNNWAYGYVDITLTDGSGALAGYLAKYMSKAYTDNRLGGQKAFICSRNIRRTQTFDTKTQISQVSEIYDLDNTEVAFSDSFDTIWAGRCDYKKLIIQ